MSLHTIKRLSNRAIFLKTHRFIGIVVGILLIIIGTTGSLLVFHDEIEAAIHPQLVQVVPEGERLSVDAIAASVQQADPNAQLEFILLPQQPEESVKVKVKSGSRELAVFVNPYNGAILGLWGFESILTHFLLKIHMTLLAGKVGEIIVGACGLFLLILCLTGLTLLFGKRQIIRVFKIRWKAPLRLLAYDLHQISGIFAILFLIFVSTTGILFVLAHNSQTFLSLFFDSLPETKLIANPQQELISITEAIQIADRELPNSKTTFLAFEEERKITVQKKYPDDIFTTGLSSVAIDRYTGNVLTVQKVLKPSLGNKVAKLITDFHYGTFGGIFTRVLYVFIGLAPTILFGTGLMMYRCRYRRQSPTDSSQSISKK